MKKISTKIIILSLVNSAFIAAINVGVSIYLSNSRTNMVAADTASAAPIQQGMPFLPPTPVLIGLGISLVLGVAMSYILGRYISRPIIKVTEITKRTADFDLIDDQLFEEPLKYKDESGAMARALLDTRKALREINILLQQSKQLMKNQGVYLTKLRI